MGASQGEAQAAASAARDERQSRGSTSGSAQCGPCTSSRLRGTGTCSRCSTGAARATSAAALRIVGSRSGCLPAMARWPAPPAPILLDRVRMISKSSSAPSRRPSCTRSATDDRPRWHGADAHPRHPAGAALLIPLGGRGDQRSDGRRHAAHRARLHPAAPARDRIVACQASADQLAGGCPMRWTSPRCCASGSRSSSTRTSAK